MKDNLQSMGCEMKSWLIGAAIGVVAFILMVVLWGWGWLASLFLGVVVAGVLGFLMTRFFCDEARGTDVTMSVEKPAPTAAPTPEHAQAAPSDTVANKAIPKPAENASAPTAAPTPPQGETSAGPAKQDQPAGVPEVEQAPDLLDAPRGAADDLKKIKGLGPKLEEKLNALGIWHYDQVAGWNAAQVDWVDEQLDARGRIARDGWVAQARALAGGSSAGAAPDADRKGS